MVTGTIEDGAGSSYTAYYKAVVKAGFNGGCDREAVVIKTPTAAGVCGVELQVGSTYLLQARTTGGSSPLPGVGASVAVVTAISCGYIKPASSVPAADQWALNEVSCDGKGGGYPKRPTTSLSPSNTTAAGAAKAEAKAARTTATTESPTPVLIVAGEDDDDEEAAADAKVYNEVHATATDGEVEEDAGADAEADKVAIAVATDGGLKEAAAVHGATVNRSPPVLVGPHGAEADEAMAAATAAATAATAR